MQSVFVFQGAVFVCFVYLISPSNVKVKHGRTCVRNSSMTVELQCSANERIHVEEESYGIGVTNSCRLQTNSCREVLQTSINGLSVNCDGQQSCNETVSPLHWCNIAATAAEVKYRCINDSMDICGFDTITTATNESVYLHSPDYPYSVGMNNSCVVRITGKDIQVTLVEQSLNGGTLTISGNGQNWSNVDTNLYNRKLPEHLSEVGIFYTNRGNDKSNVWISVVASSRMYITFNGGMIVTSATSTSLVPMSDGSSPLYGVTNQWMSQTVPIMATSTLSTNTPTLSALSTRMAASDTQTLPTVSTSTHSTDTQTLSIVSTSTLLPATVTTATYTGRDTVSAIDTATVEVTSNATITPMTIEPTTTSAAENITVGMTLGETTDIQSTTVSTTDGSDKDLVVVAASSAAVCVVAVIVAVVVAVVLCRCNNSKIRRSVTSPHNCSFGRHLELNSVDNGKHHNGIRKNDDSQHYFIIDPEFVAGNGDVALHTESRPEEGTSPLRVQDRYSTVLPRSYRLNMKDNTTFTTKQPGSITTTDNSIGSNEDKDIKTINDHIESLDSCLSDSRNSTGSTCHMTENDVYNGGPPTTENLDVSTDDGNQDEDSMPEDLYQREEAIRGDAVEGMVDNDIYESSGYDNTVAEQSGEREEVSASATLDITTQGEAEEEVDMVSNDLYHSFV
ncbi:mucin-21-like [Haliotis cracherodii]|uniref:mucin-21-like n=1 Tax=Haliotis cracherodii TaxID=6455 RepID=UPI0039EA86B9